MVNTDFIFSYGVTKLGCPTFGTTSLIHELQSLPMLPNQRICTPSFYFNSKVALANVTAIHKDRRDELSIGSNTR